MEVKILVCNLSKSGITAFEKDYKGLIENGWRVEDTHLQDTAIVFHMEKWT